MTTIAQLRAAGLTLRRQMEALVLEAAQSLPNALGFRIGYADGTWEVIVHPDGAVTNFGYAEETHGPQRTVYELTIWELGQLVEEIVLTEPGKINKARL